MTQPVYPGNLLKPQLNGYALESKNSLSQTNLTSGLMVQRQFPPTAPWQSTLNFLGSTNQIYDVQQWFKNTGKFAWFAMPLLTPHGGSSSLENHDVRITGTVGSIRAIGLLLELSVPVEIKAISTLSAEATAAAAAYGSEEILAADDLAAALASFLTGYPVEAACS